MHIAREWEIESLHSAPPHEPLARCNGPPHSLVCMVDMFNGGFIRKRVSVHYIDFILLIF